MAGDLCGVVVVEVHAIGEGEGEPDEEEEDDDYGEKEDKYLNKFINKGPVVRPGQKMGQAGHIMSSGSEFVSTISLFSEAEED